MQLQVSRRSLPLRAAVERGGSEVQGLKDVENVSEKACQPVTWDSLAALEPHGSWWSLNI